MFKIGALFYFYLFCEKVLASQQQLGNKYKAAQEASEDW